MTEKSDAFYSNTSLGFEVDISTDADDALHTDMCKAKGHPNCVETQFFGFSIPEAKIHSINWWRQHPNMNHLLGGALVFQGIKRQFLASEIADFRVFMTDEAVRDGISEVKLDNGLHTKVIEPMKRFHMSYSDPVRDSSFEVEYEAIAPAVKIKKTGHFDQLMRAKGELLLRGEKHKIECLTIRDRTWGEIRTEEHAPLPAVSWMACTLSEDFALTVTAIDDPDLNPIWKPYMDVDRDKLLLAGWVYRDKEVVGIKSIRKITHYYVDSWIPKSFEFEMVDQKDRPYHVKGDIVSASPYNPYMTINSFMCLAEGEINGEPAHIDFQDLQWTDMLVPLGRR